MQGHSLAPNDDPSLLPVSITVSVTAVFIALIALLGHRAHNRTIFTQAQTTNQWVYYESKAAGRASYDALLEFLPVAELRDPGNAGKVKEKYQQKIDQSAKEQGEIRAKAEALEMEVEHQEHAADRFDLADVCLEAALVITSITLLTRQRLYWGVGLGMACLGLLIAATGFFVA